MSRYRLYDRIHPYETPGRVVRNPETVYEVMKDLTTAEQEHMYVLYLNVRSRMLCKPFMASKGSVDGTDCAPQVIFREAVRLNAVSFILVHNHPSGSLEPSNADCSVTKRIVACCKFMDIQCNDHVIISTAGYHSLRHHRGDLFK